MTADPLALLRALGDELWATARATIDSYVAQVTQPLAALTELPDAGPGLQGRLLGRLDAPGGGIVLDLVGALLAQVPADELTWHGWQGRPGEPRGVAVCLNAAAGRAVLAVSPGPVVDLVVTPGVPLTVTVGDGAPWTLVVTVSAPGPGTWEATWRPGDVPSPALGTAEVTLTRSGQVTLDTPGDLGGVSWTAVTVGLQVSQVEPLRTTVAFDGLSTRVLPPSLQGLLGDAATAPGALALAADRLTGLRFDSGALKVPIPGRLDLPGVQVRALDVELGLDGGGPHLAIGAALTASLPGLPLTLTADGLGLRLPVSFAGGRFGIGDLSALPPSAIGVDLDLGPISGGGYVGEVDGQIRGLLEVDLGPMSVQAMALLTPPHGGEPLSFLALLTAGFPFPGIQLGFGFALDAVGGLVGINTRVDDEQLRGLVTDGNADRIMFPDNAAARAPEILNSLARSFPAEAGRHVVGPMLRLNWGGRLVRASAAVILELPDPVRVIILGRIEVSIPDPEVPLVRLRASLYGRIDPGIPLVEVLVSLAGSDIAGIPITGDLYALFRGGQDPTFVLSAGGFHPRYTRPAGVPELRRMAMDIGGGFFGLRAEAYFALTSNSLQFGGLVHLDQTIAGCGVEGHLGLDVLFVTDPVLYFSVEVRAGVAVLAFGHRLASVALRFTLEGPGQWHAFGTGSISILWWDVDLDFDVRWGNAPQQALPAPRVEPELEKAAARLEAWTLAAATDVQSPVRLTNDAKRAVVAGTLAMPEARLRFTQEVVPLQRTFDRFHRVPVEAQTWSVAEVRLSAKVTPLLGEVQARFVPGEFWQMTDDEQLSRAPFESHPSGVELDNPAPAAWTARWCDEEFETDYKVEDGWFPAPPDLSLPYWVLAHRVFALETFVRRLAASERVARWQAEQSRVAAMPAVLRVL